MNRRVAALLVAVLSSTVLMAFVIFTQQQAEERRLDAEVFARINAISIAASAGDLTVEEANAFWNRAGGEILNEMSRLQVPVVITDTLGNPLNYSHLPDDFPRTPEGGYDQEALREFARNLEETRGHFDIPGGQVHFGDPAFLGRLRLIPYLIAASLLVILGGGGWLLFASFRSERERIWSAMARESAHQMGTPLSSLVGWLELIETQDRSELYGTGELDVIDEMAADVERLQKVSRRFELIGRKPTLDSVSLGTTVEQLRRYFKVRLPSLSMVGKIDIVVDIGADAPKVLGNATLLEWAFENLIRNAVDSLAPDGGRIVISYLGPNGKRAVYRVSDTGPGVPPSIRDKIFDIGVTTKERGWGVGLSLTRRIIEDMHNGLIQLEDTRRSASFRIEIPQSREGKKKV